MTAIHNILYENEKILWEGRPEKTPYITGGLISAIPLFLFGFFFAGFVVVFAILAHHSPLSWAIFLFPHFWIGIGMMVFPFISAILSYSRIAYALTDKRAIIEHGIINHTISSIDYDKMSNASVVTSMVDDWYGQNTGTILLAMPAIVANIALRAGASGSFQHASAFQHIKEPYSVFKFLQKTELDVKSDIEYPNALRPNSNPGYQTQYKTPDMPNEMQQETHVLHGSQDPNQF